MTNDVREERDAMKFRKKPVVIEAVQLSMSNFAEVRDWINGGYTLAADRKAFHGNGPVNVTIRTLEGDMRAKIGDWIIKGVKGEFYPCKPGIFAATYEPAERSSSAPDALRAMLKEWREKREAATQGEWRHCQGFYTIKAGFDPNWMREPEVVHSRQEVPYPQGDLDFITHAANNAAPLLDAVEALMAERCAEPSDFVCPNCGGIHFGREVKQTEPTVILGDFRCSDQFGVGCQWQGKTGRKGGANLAAATNHALQQKLRDLLAERDELQREKQDADLLLGSGWQQVVEIARGEQGVETALRVQCTKLAGDVAELRDRLAAEVERAQNENHRLANSLPWLNDRTRDEAKRLLGDVYRMRIGPNGDYPEIGVVEVNKANEAIVALLADINALRDMVHLQARQLRDAKAAMEGAIENMRHFKDNSQLDQKVLSSLTAALAQIAGDARKDGAE